MAVSLRSTLKVLVGVSLAALGSLLLLELSARIFLFGLAGLHPGRIGSVHPLWETGFLQTSTHEALGYEFKPDVDGYFKLARLRTNSRGLRDREYSLEKPPDTFRVAVLGASFALPAGVEIEDSFHSVLERRLTAESSSLAYEFINFAVGTYGPRQALAALRLRALDYDPDLVLLAVTKLSMPQLTGAWDSAPAGAQEPAAEERVLRELPRRAAEGAARLDAGRDDARRGRSAPRMAFPA